MEVSYYLSVSGRRYCGRSACGAGSITVNPVWSRTYPRCSSVWGRKYPGRAVCGVGGILGTAVFAKGDSLGRALAGGTNLCREGVGSRSIPG